MNETDFQALFDSYQESLRARQENPVPQKLHLMIYNYALLRHQQSSDVSADFYLHVVGKLQGILDRYDPRRIPFYQYLAGCLNFEFSHFLRRRRLPRSQTELIPLDELTERQVALEQHPGEDIDRFYELFHTLKPQTRIYAKLALALPLTYGELRQLTGRKRAKDAGAAWAILRAYRSFLRFAEDKRQHFLNERDRLMKVLMRIDHEMLALSQTAANNLSRRRESARKKFFSIDTRIPIRIVAAVSGDSIATAQRQLKSALQVLKMAYFQWEKQKLAGKKRKIKEAD